MGTNNGAAHQGSQDESRHRMTATNHPHPEHDGATRTAKDAYADAYRTTGTRAGGLAALEAEAYAEDATRYGNAHARTPGVGDRVTSVGDTTATVGVIHALTRDDTFPAGYVEALVVWGVDGESPSRPLPIPLSQLVLDTHSVAATTDAYFESGCGADVLARTAALVEQDRVRAALPRGVADYRQPLTPFEVAAGVVPVEGQHAADVATVRGWDGEPEGAGGYMAALARLSDVASLPFFPQDAAPVEVEAALPGEWVVSVGTSVNDERAAVEWVDLPGRHTLRGAAEQVRHLTIEGYVREVRILRA